MKSLRFLLPLIVTITFAAYVTAQPNTGNNVKIVDSGGTQLDITAANAAKVDGSGVTQPVSGSVGMTGAIPAGTNNIGDVDVASSVLPTGASTAANQTTGNTSLGTLAGTVAGSEQQVDVVGSLPAGTNNIGDVDVLTVPADPFGVNADAASATGSISAKLRQIANLLAGTLTVGSHAVTNAGTFATQSAQSGTWTVQPGNTQNSTPWIVAHIPVTAGGLTTFHLVSAATTNATVVKASAGQLYGWYIYNSNAAARKVAFHNTASAPTAGASIFKTLVIPPTSGANVEFSQGIAFSTGIAITTVTGLADNDSAAVAANDLVINLYYK